MQDSVNQPGFLFHDYETFGTSPSLDRPAQFAAIRTDAELNVLGEPEVFYCKPADDYLPQPQAVMITGITPQEAGLRDGSDVLIGGAADKSRRPPRLLQNALLRAHGPIAPSQGGARLAACDLNSLRSRPGAS